ncbi:MAG: response regulator [Deltaproteobacteria bacterium]|nr:response regulator [Deltaproteobacteria bacterium]
MTKRNLLEGKKILVVDDEPDILDTVKELLSMCRVTKALDFESAKDLLERESFDIVILDIMGVRGYDLLEVATAREITAVMLTANAMSPENVEKSQKEGAAFFVPKEKVSDIAVYLNDILDAQEKGQSTWSRWFNRMADYFEEKFGPDWQKKHGTAVR